MTRRERLEAKLAKREEWATKRRQKASALTAQTDPSLRHDWAFITQPGIIPERTRMNRRDARAWEHTKTAEHHTGKAIGLQQHLDRTIFTDDPDAIEQLEARLSEREAEAEKKTAWNTAWKRGAAKAEKAARAAGKSSEDLLIARLDGGEAALVAAGAPASIVAAANTTMEQGYSWVKSPFDLTSLRANIRRDRERLAEVRARQSTARKAAASLSGYVIEGSGDWVSVTFAEKPSSNIIQRLRAAGFVWGSGSWTGRRADLPALGE